MSASLYPYISASAVNSFSSTPTDRACHEKNSLKLEKNSTKIDKISTKIDKNSTKIKKISSEISFKFNYQRKIRSKNLNEISEEIFLILVEFLSILVEILSILMEYQLIFVSKGRCRLTLE